MKLLSCCGAANSQKSEPYSKNGPSSAILLPGSEAIEAILSGKERDVSFILDVSVREPGTTTPFGQTTKSLSENYKLIREFGIKRLQLISLQYGDKYTVQDQFVESLIEAGDNLSGCFASFPLDDSTTCLEKIQKYKIPNAFVDCFWGNKDMDPIDPLDANAKLAVLKQTILRLRKLLPSTCVFGANGPVGEICINFGDFMEYRKISPEIFQKIFEECARLDVQIIAFEEFRGIALPEDSYETARSLREYFPAGKFKIISHMHGGNGLDDACNLSAVLGGADGVWAAIVPTAATAGHGTSLVYLTNLIRYGNKKVEYQFHMKKSCKIAKSLYNSNFANTERIQSELPLIGENAYSLQVQAFSQESGKKGMLPSNVIGRDLKHRFVPLVYDLVSIKARLAELGYKNPTDEMAYRLIEETQRRLLADKYEAYDTREDFNSKEFIDSIMQPLVCRRNKQTPSAPPMERNWRALSVLKWSSFPEEKPALPPKTSGGKGKQNPFYVNVQLNVKQNINRGDSVNGTAFD